MTFNYCHTQTKTEGLNLIFISLDTARFDYVDTGNGARARTPALKNFSNNAIIFDKAFVTIPETLPSHLSIFTSHYPHQLGVMHNHSRYNGKYPMIQEVLKKQRYYTYGIISLMSLIEPGFWKGFDEFNRQLCSQEINHLFLTADKISHHARMKLEKIKKRKFFMFVHFSDPHYPYGPPTVKGIFNVYLNGKKMGQLNPYKGMILPRQTLNPGKHQFRFEMETSASDFKGMGIIELTRGSPITEKSKNIEFRKDIFSGCYFMKGNSAWMNLECKQKKDIHLQILPKLKIKSAARMYQKEVEYLDEHLGHFLQHIKNQGLMKKTIIVIFSDHGEGLGERNNYLGHVEYVNQQFIRVPLMIYIPGKNRQIIDTPVSMAGLSSTILELLKLKGTSFRHSFLNLLQNKNSPAKPIYSFTYHTPGKSNKISLIKWPFQGIFNWINTEQSSELYNLELSNSFSANHQIEKENFSKKTKQFFSFFIKESLEQKKRILLSKSTNRNIDRQKIEKLKRLGYIN